MRGNNVLQDLYDDKYGYRPDGRIAGVQHLFDRQAGSRDVYVYDDARRKVEIQTYRADGLLVMRVSHAYDEHWNETRSEIVIVENKAAPRIRQVSETEHTYDEKGQVLSTSVKGDDGRTIVTAASRREADGRLITTMKDLREAAQGTLAKTVVTLDARGEELSTETYAADGTLTSKTTYERKFDARGNWVEEVTRVWQKKELMQESSFLIRRTIKYF
jgi:hypothetical protein